jgi:hypothetical protein
MIGEFSGEGYVDRTLRSRAPVRAAKTEGIVMTEESAQAKKSGRGCLFYGVLVVAVLLLVVVFAALMGVRYARNLVTQITDTEPMTLPAVEMSEADINRLQRRIERFRVAIQRGEAVEPLAVTAGEINALIATDPDVAAFRDRLYVFIEGGQLRAHMSFPAPELGLEMLRGRYVNATGTFAVALRDGHLRINAVALEARGKPVPENIMRRIRAVNIARELNDDPRVAGGLEHLSAIQVKDEQMLIVPLNVAEPASTTVP